MYFDTRESRHVALATVKAAVAYSLAVVAGALAGGCHTASVGRAVEPYALVFAREEGDRITYQVQALDDGAPTRAAVNLAPRAGNLRTAARAAIAAVTTSRDSAGGELRLTKLAPDGAGDRIVANEWAWDFSLSDDGGAIAFVAGRDRRQLFVARAPEWIPRSVPFGEGEATEPRWMSADELLLVRSRAGSELVRLNLATGAIGVLARSADTFSEPTPAGADVLVVESTSSPKPGRLLRVPLAGGEPHVAATGFFVPGTLVVAPRGGGVGVASSAELRAVQSRTAAFRWLGPSPENIPAELPGVVSATWSPDGRHLAVARQSGVRRWVEVHAAGQPARPVRLFEFPGAACFAPQWWPAAPLPVSFP
jgi:hypothetical protein